MNSLHSRRTELNRNSSCNLTLHRALLADWLGDPRFDYKLTVRPLLCTPLADNSLPLDNYPNLADTEYSAVDIDSDIDPILHSSSLPHSPVHIHSTELVSKLQLENLDRVRMSLMLGHKYNQDNKVYQGKPLVERKIVRRNVVVSDSEIEKWNSLIADIDFVVTILHSHYQFHASSARLAHLLLKRL